MDTWLSWVLLLMGFLLVRVLFERIKAGKRKDVMESAAKTLDFEFKRETNLSSENKHGIYAYSDLDATNYMFGHVKGTDISIFNLFTEDHEGHRNYDHMAVLVSGFSGRVPSFQLSPESFLTREHGRDKLDINFESHPEFSRAYTLHGKNPYAVGELFNDDALTFFARNKGLDLKGQDDTLVFSARAAKTPKEVISLVRTALAAKEVLDPVAGATPTGTRRSTTGTDPERRQALRFHRWISLLLASLFWGLAAFLWYDSGFRISGFLIIFMGLLGTATFVVSFFLRDADADTEMSPDKYAPWKSGDEQDGTTDQPPHHLV